MTKDEVIELALGCGFIISTAHGQWGDKLMTVSDNESLLKFRSEEHTSELQSH